MRTKNSWKTKRKRTTKSNFQAARSQHPFRLWTHLTSWTRLPAALLLAVVSCAAAGAGVAGAGQDEPKSRKRVPDFVIFGTVFNEKGFSLPGAEVKVRRAGEKRVRGEAISDRRGEFAVRVPRGAEYEVTVRARGFAEQTQKVNADSGATREDLIFRMAPATGGKPK